MRRKAHNFSQKQIIALDRKRHFARYALLQKLCLFEALYLPPLRGTGDRPPEGHLQKKAYTLPLRHIKNMRAAHPATHPRINASAHQRINSSYTPRPPKSPDVTYATETARASGMR